MSPPLPVPSKAAIRALRGLALGTSCAIGVIVEDRSRRITTLRTAINNKEKIKAARQYHGALEHVPLQLEEAVLGPDEIRLYQGGLTPYDNHRERRQSIVSPYSRAKLYEESGDHDIETPTTLPRTSKPEET